MSQCYAPAHYSLHQLLGVKDAIYQVKLTLKYKSSKATTFISAALGVALKEFRLLLMTRYLPYPLDLPKTPGC